MNQLLRRSLATLALAGTALGVTACAGGSSTTAADPGTGRAVTATAAASSAPAVATEAATTPVVLTGATADQVDAADALEPMFHRHGETGPTTWSSMSEFLGYAHYKIGLYWKITFENAGLARPNPVLRALAPGEKVASACRNGDGTTAVTDDQSAFYCPADDTIYFSQKFAGGLWSGTVTGPLGQKLRPANRDFAVVYALAHEYGHAVQAKLRLGRTHGTPAFEQQADCFSGAFAAAASGWNLLDEGDVKEALAAAWLVGDDGDDHGTPAQRQAAFALGFQAGLGSCFDY